MNFVLGQMGQQSLSHVVAMWIQMWHEIVLSEMARRALVTSSNGRTKSDERPVLRLGLGRCRDIALYCTVGVTRSQEKLTHFFDSKITKPAYSANNQCDKTPLDELKQQPSRSQTQYIRNGLIPVLFDRSLKPKIAVRVEVPSSQAQIQTFPPTNPTNLLPSPCIKSFPSFI